MTKEHWIQLLVGIGGVVVFGGGAVAWAIWTYARSAPVTMSCADLDGEPSALVLRLEGCVADLNDLALEEGEPRDGDRRVRAVAGAGSGATDPRRAAHPEPRGPRVGARPRRRDRRGGAGPGLAPSPR
ncbi:MAG: hypothetical protein M5U28_37705 [Sandaracinaceae bacterium]|nr:hypothetical protein [Sandaracinaceae bacterium]